MNSTRTKAASTVEEGFLSSIDLFRDLPASCLEALYANSTVREYKAGHLVFQVGEGGEGLFILEKGRVETFRTSGKKKLIVADLEPPAVFGEMGCVGQCLYHCSAQTSEASRIRIIAQTDLQNLLEKYPSVTRRLLDLVSERFLNVLLDLEATSFKHLIPRLAKLLLKKAEEDFVLDMTHQEIAKHLRVYRESATAALGELKKAGIIAVERKRIRIIDRGRLERAGRE